MWNLCSSENPSNRIRFDDCVGPHTQFMHKRMIRIKPNFDFNEKQARNTGYVCTSWYGIAFVFRTRNQLDIIRMYVALHLFRFVGCHFSSLLRPYWYTYKFCLIPWPLLPLYPPHSLYIIFTSMCLCDTLRSAFSLSYRHDFGVVVAAAETPEKCKYM